MSSITTNSPPAPPKRRLSLFSFGSKKNVNQNNNGTTTTTANSKDLNNIDKSNKDEGEGTDPHSRNSNSTQPQQQQEQQQLMSPNSPLSLTDENLNNFNHINALPPPSIASTTVTSNNNNTRAPSDTMSESSLIFERYVQDPFHPMQFDQAINNNNNNSNDYNDHNNNNHNHDNSNAPPSPPVQQPQRQNSQFIAPPAHLTNENFIPAAIDSTATLIQSNVDLDEVDMIYSPRRSSVANLNSAFNTPQGPLSRRSSMLTNNSKFQRLERSSSMLGSPFVGGGGNNNNGSQLSPTSQQQPQSQSQSQQQQPPFLRDRKSTISFLSYADMIQSEEQDPDIPRRPSISQTLSSSFLASPTSNSQYGNSSAALSQRPRTESLSSRTPMRQPALFTNSPSISRQTSARNSLLGKLNTSNSVPSSSSIHNHNHHHHHTPLTSCLNQHNHQQQQQQSPSQSQSSQKFHLAPESPTSESSDNETTNNDRQDVLSKRNSRSRSSIKRRPSSSTSPSSRHSQSGQSGLNISFTPSNASSAAMANANATANANANANSNVSPHDPLHRVTSQTIDNVLESPPHHDVVITSVGDTLRQYKQDIRSA